MKNKGRFTKKNAKENGSKGGLSTVRGLGVTHYSKIGKKGAEKLWGKTGDKLVA